MECKFGRKCFSKDIQDAAVEKCSECDKGIYVKCFNKMLRMLDEEEYDGNLVCPKRCMNHSVKSNMC